MKILHLTLSLLFTINISSFAQSTEEPIFTIVEEMPCFPDKKCAKLKSYKKKHTCTNKKLVEYIYNNIIYPQKAKEKKIEGIAIVLFIVNSDGSLTGIKVLQDPSGEQKLFHDACLNLVQKMIKEKGPWIPGKQNGKAVRVVLKMPISFKL